MEKIEWKLKKEIGALVLKAGGTIFGGYIRDSIIHDHYAKLYYENATPEEAIDARYNDPTFFPEYKERTLIPEDIDCFFPTPDFLKNFESLLLQHKFCFSRLFTHTDASEYIPRLQKFKHALSHTRYKITLINPHKTSLIRMLLLQSIPASTRDEVLDPVNDFLEVFSAKLTDLSHILVDILIPNNPIDTFTPPFGQLDFECNGLVLTSQGLSLANDLKDTQTSQGFITDINKLATIHQDILHKKATLVKGNLLDIHRITKMKNKGWTISHDPFTNIIPLDTTPEPDPELSTCIICHASFEATAPGMKLKCCAAKYHSHCLLEAALKGPAAMTVTKSCIMCKRTIRNISYDMSILQCNMTIP